MLFIFFMILIMIGKDKMGTSDIAFIRIADLLPPTQKYFVLQQLFGEQLADFLGARSVDDISFSSVRNKLGKEVFIDRLSAILKNYNITELNPEMPWHDNAAFLLSQFGEIVQSKEREAIRTFLDNWTTLSTVFTPYSVFDGQTQQRTHKYGTNESTTTDQIVEWLMRGELLINPWLCTMSEDGSRFAHLSFVFIGQDIQPVAAEKQSWWAKWAKIVDMKKMKKVWKFFEQAAKSISFPWVKPRQVAAAMIPAAIVAPAMMPWGGEVMAQTKNSLTPLEQTSQEWQAFMSKNATIFQRLALSLDSSLITTDEEKAMGKYCIDGFWTPIEAGKVKDLNKFPDNTKPYYATAKLVWINGINYSVNGKTGRDMAVLLGRHGNWWWFWWFRIWFEQITSWFSAPALKNFKNDAKTWFDRNISDLSQIADFNKKHENDRKEYLALRACIESTTNQKILKEKYIDKKAGSISLTKTKKWISLTKKWAISQWDFYTLMEEWLNDPQVQKEMFWYLVKQYKFWWNETEITSADFAKIYAQLEKTQKKINHNENFNHNNFLQGFFDYIENRMKEVSERNAQTPYIIVRKRDDTNGKYNDYTVVDWDTLDKTHDIVPIWWEGGIILYTTPKNPWWWNNWNLWWSTNVNAWWNSNNPNPWWSTNINPWWNTNNPNRWSSNNVNPWWKTNGNAWWSTNINPWGRTNGNAWWSNNPNTIPSMSFDDLKDQLNAISWDANETAIIQKFLRANPSYSMSTPLSYTVNWSTPYNGTLANLPALLLDSKALRASIVSCSFAWWKIIVETKK